MKVGLYFRTLRFVAYSWGFPFFAGIAVSMLLVTWANVELLEVISPALDQAIAKACH